jgi:hypothetical protein
MSQCTQKFQVQYLKYRRYQNALQKSKRALTHSLQYCTSHPYLLAFAEDIVLVARPVDQVQDMLASINTGLTNVDLDIAISKCSTFETVTRNKTWAVRNTTLLQ